MAARFGGSSQSRHQPGAHMDAGEVGSHLELLRQEQHGELTPEDVVKDARNPNSPLHSHFEWDDTRAAEQHRLNQARNLIRSVVAIYTSDKKPAQRVRAFVHVPEKGAPHYRSTDHAMSQTKTRNMVLRRAWRELKAWRDRYRELKEFSALIETIDETEKNLPKAVNG